MVLSCESRFKFGTMKAFAVIAILGFAVASVSAYTSDEIREIVESTRNNATLMELVDEDNTKFNYDPLGPKLNLPSLLDLKRGNVEGINNFTIATEILINKEDPTRAVIPLYFEKVTYYFDYKIAILYLIRNEGKLRGTFSQLRIDLPVKINEDKTFCLDFVPKFQMYQKTLNFLKGFPIMDPIFNLLAVTFFSAIDYFVQRTYIEDVSRKIVERMNAALV